jgi:hypothetical protein
MIPVQHLNQRDPSFPLSSNPEQELLRIIQQHIVENHFSKAIKNLFLLLPDVTDALPLQSLYSCLFHVIPYLDDSDFARLLDHLLKLFELSPGLHEEQRQLALSLAPDT